MAEFDNSPCITKDDFKSLEKWVVTWGPGNQDEEFSKILKTETRKSWCAMLGIIRRDKHSNRKEGRNLSIMCKFASTSFGIFMESNIVYLTLGLLS